ncbi:unnamed protein product [Thelazia callipaeda]|uniref:Calcium-binding mitochondrial carrier protein SCaMC-1 n=1 Tax=Thelazia callipaeda TaxID=103827 RepID=A0A158RBS5_THECL|nr:unnamed protein product [Thelazia callipaeda]
MFISNAHEISEEKEKHLRELYDRLDVNKDGTVDIRDLTNALKLKAPHIPTGIIPELFARINHLNDNKITFSDFVHYALEHEKNLEVIFRDLDENKDGYVDIQEIQKYCEDLGLSISDAKAQSIVERMGQTGSVSVNLSEFKDFMLLYPRSKPEEIAKFWKHNLVIDIGEDSQIPDDFSQQEIASGFWWKHLAAGGAAGCMSRTCTAPLDRVKIYLQVHANRNNRLHFSKAAKILYEEGGIKSFWRGNGVNVAKIAPESALKFLSYDLIKQMIVKCRGNDHELQISERLAAGSSAGVISQTIIYPMEVLKTRLALRRTGQLDRGLMHFAISLYTNEGFRCFYKGIVPNLFGIIPYAGIDLAVYETLKSYYLKNYGVHPVGNAFALPLCGAFSSICGMLASYPFALVRTRLQALTVSGNLAQPDTLTGQVQCIWKNDGVSGFYRGLTPNLIKAIPAVAISYFVYEHVRNWLGAPMTYIRCYNRRLLKKLYCFNRIMKIHFHWGAVGDSIWYDYDSTRCLPQIICISRLHIYWLIDLIRNMRDGISAFPVTLSDDEKRLKEKMEKLRSIRKSIAALNKGNVGSLSGDLKVERKTTKQHILQAEVATEEVKRKVLLGTVTFKKADEKKDSFKRSSLIAKRRKIATNNTESVSAGTSNDVNSEKSICAGGTSDITKTQLKAPETVEASKPASDTNKPGVSNAYNSESCVSTHSIGLDNNKPVQIQTSSFDGGGGLFGSTEQQKGPCVYVRGYDMTADSLQSAFSRFGGINRVFVEERQKSAFITFTTTAEAEAAIEEVSQNVMYWMDGNMVNGITVRVSFARRQNQNSDTGRFRGGRMFDRSRYFRNMRSGHFRSCERGLFYDNNERSDRKRISESGECFEPVISENVGSSWSSGSKAQNSTWSGIEQKGGFSSVKKLNDTGCSKIDVCKNQGKEDISSSKSIAHVEMDGFDASKPIIPIQTDDGLHTCKPDNHDNTLDSDMGTSKSVNYDNTRDAFNISSPKKSLDVGNRDNFESRGRNCGNRWSCFSRDRRGSRLMRQTNECSNRGCRNLQRYSRNQNHYFKSSDNSCCTDETNNQQSSSLAVINKNVADLGLASGSQTNLYSRTEDRWPAKRTRDDESQDKDDNSYEFKSGTSNHFNLKSGDKAFVDVAEKWNDNRKVFRGNKRINSRYETKGVEGLRHHDLDNGCLRSEEHDKAVESWHGMEEKSAMSGTWFGTNNDKQCDSQPTLPPMSEVQIAWSEASKYILNF